MNELYSKVATRQIAMMRSRINAGMPRAGWKVGINVPEVQHKLGISHPLVGWLDGDRLFQSGATVPLPPSGKAHVEPELCLRIRTKVDPSMSSRDAYDAVDCIAAALELVDYAQPTSSLNDVMANSMFHYATVVGPWKAPQDDLSIASAVTLRVDSARSAPARSDLVPMRSADLVLLVSELLAEMNEQLLPGDHIISGSFTAKALPLAAGQVAEAELGRFGTARCTAHSG